MRASGPRTMALENVRWLDTPAFSTDGVTPAATWGADPQETGRILQGLRAAIANDDAELPACIFDALPPLTFAHLADILKLAKSSWSPKPSKGQCLRRALWLLLDGNNTGIPHECTRPNIRTQPAHSACSVFRQAVERQVGEAFSKAVDSARNRMKVSVHQVRATIAQSSPWNELMIDTVRETLEEPSIANETFRLALTRPRSSSSAPPSAHAGGHATPTGSAARRTPTTLAASSASSASATTAETPDSAAVTNAAVVTALHAERHAAYPPSTAFVPPPQHPPLLLCLGNVRQRSARNSSRR